MGFRCGCPPTQKKPGARSRHTDTHAQTHTRTNRFTGLSVEIQGPGLEFLSRPHCFARQSSEWDTGTIKGNSSGKGF